MQRSRFISKRPNRRRERGYMLLYLLFLVAVLAISLVAIVPTLKFVIKRDQEQEMVHRGEQYRRAIRRYYRRMGSYPASLDVLENTNDMRFLRKRYKDPMNHNKDFKTLTQIDLMKAMGTALSQNAGIAGAQTLGQPIGDPNATDPNSTGGTTSGVASGQTPADPNAAANQGQAGAGANGNTTTINNNPNNTLPFTSISGQPSGPGAGVGAGLVGVASLSGDETIRIYNKKNHYKDWLFIYDPSTDRGGLLTGPYQPQLQTFTQGLNGQNNGLSGLGQGLNPGTNNGLGPGMYTPGNNPGTSVGTGLQH
jgi:type II secretory pathway pseudopilin PulG